MAKCQIFQHNPWTIPFEKIPIFGLFLTSCFYCLNRRFSLLVYREKYYSGLFCLEQKDGRFQIFDKNHGLSPSEKFLFFVLFNFLFLQCERRSAFLKYRETHIPGLFSHKYKHAKFEIFDQKHGPTPFKECLFFDFIKFLFLQSKKAFFLCRISLDAFSGLILPQKKKTKKFPIF